mgnify:CR=1 FL=1
MALLHTTISPPRYNSNLVDFMFPMVTRVIIDHMSLRETLYLLKQFISKGFTIKPSNNGEDYIFPLGCSAHMCVMAITMGGSLLVECVLLMQWLPQSARNHQGKNNSSAFSIPT